jgi:hypothetical protein
MVNGGGRPQAREMPLERGFDNFAAGHRAALANAGEVC